MRSVAKTDSEPEYIAKYAGDIDLIAASIGDSLEMTGDFAGSVSADSLQVKGQLFMRAHGGEKAQFHDVRLPVATVLGELDMTGATFSGDLIAHELRVDHSIEMGSSDGNQTIFKNVEMKRARIATTLDISGTTVEGSLDLNAAMIGDSALLMSSGANVASFKSIDMSNARIGSQVALDGAALDGDLSLNGATVGGSVLMRSLAANVAKFKSIDLTTAKIGGEVALDGATVNGNLSLNGATVGGDVTLGSTAKKIARFDSIEMKSAKIGLNVVLDGASLKGAMSLNLATVGSSVLMRSTADNAANFNSIDMPGAKIGSNLELDGAKVDAAISLDGATIGSSVFMRSNLKNAASFRRIDMTGAKIGSQLSLDGATVADNISLNGVIIGDSVFIRSIAETDVNPQYIATFKGDIDLGTASIGNSLYLTGDFSGSVKAYRLRVNGAVFMQGSDAEKAAFGDVSLEEAHVAGQLFMGSAEFGNLDIHDVQADQSINLAGASVGGKLNAENIHIGKNLYFTSDDSSASFNEVDLRGANILGELQLGNEKAAVVWTEADPSLDLTLATIGVLRESPETWPEKLTLHLDGLSFGRLASLLSPLAPQKRPRSTDWWLQWAARDDSHSVTPFEQLHAAFVSVDDAPSARDILYGQRLQQGRTKRGWAWYIDTLEWAFFGYFIGWGGLRLWWFFLIIFVGSVITLRMHFNRVRLNNPPGESHSLIWCVVACVFEVLQIKKKEYSEYFDDHNRNQFGRIQKIVFVTLSMSGLVFAALIALVKSNSL